MPSPGPRIAALVAVVVLAAVVVELLRRGYSDLVAFDARYRVERLAAAGHRPQPARLDAIRADFERALAQVPGDPQLLEDLGRVIEQQAVVAGIRSPEERALRSEALARYRAAVAARPTSARAMLGLAILKFRLGEVDREFAFFLARALETGPWDPQVQRLAIHAGLAAWQALPAPARERVTLAVRNQMSWVQVDQRLEIVVLLRRYGRLDLLPADPATAR